MVSSRYGLNWSTPKCSIAPRIATLVENFADEQKGAQTGKKEDPLIQVLIEAALRCLLFVPTLVFDPQAFRIGSVLGQRAALDLAPTGPLAMPLPIPITGRLRFLPAKSSKVLPTHPMTLLEELQARIQAKSGSATQSRPIVASTAPANPPWTESSDSPPGAAAAPPPKELDRPSPTGDPIGTRLRAISASERV